MAERYNTRPSFHPAQPKTGFALTFKQGSYNLTKIIDLPRNCVTIEYISDHSLEKVIELVDLWIEINQYAPNRIRVSGGCVASSNFRPQVSGTPQLWLSFISPDGQILEQTTNLQFGLQRGTDKFKFVNIRASPDIDRVDIKAIAKVYIDARDCEATDD